MINRLVLKLTDERCRVAARALLELLERDGDVLPEAAEHIRAALDHYDDERIHEKCAAVALDENWS